MNSTKIYDCFTFYNEFDLLKLRLEYLYEHVEKFYITEANITFTGIPKKYNYLEYKSEFSRWNDKIQYIPVDFDVVCESQNFEKVDPWKIEALQRNSLVEHIKGLPEAVFIISDLDEIWNPQVLRGSVGDLISHGALRMEMDFFYYYINCKGVGPANSKWYYPFAMTSSKLSNDKYYDIDFIRKNINMPYIMNSGWHFSYLGGVDSIIKKISSFSHQEYNQPEFKNRDSLLNSMNLGKDPFNRNDHQWFFCDLNIFPNDLLDIAKKFPQFIRM